MCCGEILRRVVNVSNELDYESKEYRDMKAQKMAIERGLSMKISLTKEDLQLLIEGKTIGFYDGRIQIVVK